jgi:hypothetical protein
MIVTFLMPNWSMDMSLRGWTLQVLFSLPLVVLLFLLFKAQTKKHFAFLQLNIVRWGVLCAGILVYYNVVFWLALREYMMPLFMFANHI